MPDNQPRPIETAATPQRSVASSAEHGSDSDLVEQAEKLIDEGHAEKAIATLDASIAVAPGRPGAWRTKALVLRQLGRVKEADEILDAALKHVGAEPGLLLDKAELHFLEGEFARASETFDRVTNVAPGNVEAWLGLGRSLLYQGQPEQALECAKRAIKLDAQSTPGYTLCGDSLLDLRKWDEAFTAFVHAAEHDRHQFDSSSWAARGDRLRENAQPELALRAYERAIAQDGQNPEGWHGKGTILKAQKDIKGALAAFARASEVGKAFIAGFLDAGALCAENGELDRAVEFFERAKSARPSDPRPWIAIGGVDETLGRYDEARIAYERATIIDPSDAETWNSFGNSLFRLYRYDEALRAYERAIDVRPDSSWALSNLAHVLVIQQRFDEAMPHIERAIELEPENGIFWTIKLWILNFSDADVTVIRATADRILMVAGVTDRDRIDVAGVLAENGLLDRAREVLQGIDHSKIEYEVARLGLAECLLLTGETVPALNLLRNIDGRQLGGSKAVVQSFLHLLWDRLAGAPKLSEELLLDFLYKLGKRIDEIEAQGRSWGFQSIEWVLKGARRLVTHSELPLLDKLVLATLNDLQDAKIQRADLSFFVDMWPKLHETMARTRYSGSSPTV